MKRALILFFSLATSPVLAVPQMAPGGPPIGVMPPYTTGGGTDAPPPSDAGGAQSPPPYNPYGSIDGAPGSAFSDANAAAMHFLNIVDNQAYGGAWLDSADLVHVVVSQNLWSAGMRAVREPLGLVRARKLTSHQAVRTLPGGLDGQFMIIKYSTQFAYKQNAVEVVTLMARPPLMVWKVLSYRIGR